MGSHEEQVRSFLAVAHHEIWTGRGPVNEGVMFGQLSVLLFSFFEECARVCGNGCVSECLYDAILVRRFWTVEKDV